MTERSTILENLHEARAFLASVSERKTDLSYFIKGGLCGTTYCGAGWLTTAPKFKDLMVLRPVHERAELVVAPANTDKVPRNYYGNIDFSWLDDIFGPDAFFLLFQGREASDLDGRHPETDGGLVPKKVSDKELILWRFDQRIKDLS